MYVVYILKCKDASYYVGSTDDLEGCIAVHNSGGGTVFTAKRRPVELVYQEAFDTPSAAGKRERQIKRWSRPKKEALITGCLPALKEVSTSRASNCIQS
jgi:putative endonuclease